MIGLGRMGANMTERLLNGGHRVVAYARTPEKVQSVVKKGADGARSLEELVSKLTPKRIIWLMIPAGNPEKQTRFIRVLPEDSSIPFSSILL